MTSWKNRSLCALTLGVLLLGAWVIARQPAEAVGDKGTAPAATAAAYSVVFTEGHNLIVTDNKSNTLYFYTIDKDAAIGSELKLRGQIDLKNVGKATIQPTRTKADKD